MPVEDVQVRNEIEAIFKALLADNSQAWELRATAPGSASTAKKSERKRPAQTLFMRRRERARASRGRTESAVMWRRHHGACRRGHRRRLEHRAPARRARRAAGPLGAGRCSRLGAASSATARSPNGSSRRQPSSSPATPRTRAARRRASSRCWSRAPAARPRTATSCSRRSRSAARCPSASWAPAEEGRLAFLGAVGLATPRPRRTVAVVRRRRRLGAGRRRDAARRPGWPQSIDLGSQRLTSRLLHDDPPGERAVRRARAEVARLSDGLVPPAPRTASRSAAAPARSAHRRHAPRSEELAYLLDLLASRPLRSSASATASPPSGRARSPPGGHPRRPPAVARRAAEGRPRWASRRCGRGAR